MDSITPHHDREQIGEGLNPNIVSISLGFPRSFQLKYHNLLKTGVSPPEKKTIEFKLGNGDLFILILILMGQTNQYWTHCIPKEPDLDMTHDRINLTFRET